MKNILKIIFNINIIITEFIFIKVIEDEIWVYLYCIPKECLDESNKSLKKKYIKFTYLFKYFGILNWKTKSKTLIRKLKLV